jgi:predicted secreted hydrolase
MLLFIASNALAIGWTFAHAGYRYEFPRDHFNHPDYQTEWWYYTGNLQSDTGHRFGFELTFFRTAEKATVFAGGLQRTIWFPDQIYFAHLALSDIDSDQFFHQERINRAGPGLAGVDEKTRRYWNGNWQARWTDVATGEQTLEAVGDSFALQLNLKPAKPVVIHGRDGVSRKGPLPGDASQYISFTRLDASGTIQQGTRTTAVKGTAWMDHEFFTPAKGSDITGWDWFAIQLNNREELMLYSLRTNATENSPYSSGTYVDANGRSRFLDATSFSVTPQRYWKSSQSGASYPIAWNIEVPSLNLHISESPQMSNQELFSKGGVSPSYWEGAATYDGREGAAPVKGVGYLELTGYAGKVNLGAD